MKDCVHCYEYYDTEIFHFVHIFKCVICGHKMCIGRAAILEAFYFRTIPPWASEYSLPVDAEKNSHAGLI